MARVGFPKCNSDCGSPLCVPQLQGVEAGSCHPTGEGEDQPTPPVVLMLRASPEQVPIQHRGAPQEPLLCA